MPEAKELNYFYRVFFSIIIKAITKEINKENLLFHFKNDSFAVENHYRYIKIQFKQNYGKRSSTYCRT